MAEGRALTRPQEVSGNRQQRVFQCPVIPWCVGLTSLSDGASTGKNAHRTPKTHLDAAQASFHYWLPGSSRSNYGAGIGGGAGGPKAPAS